jgi:hypothetical protein
VDVHEHAGAQQREDLEEEHGHVRAGEDAVRAVEEHDVTRFE